MNPVPRTPKRYLPSWFGSGSGSGVGAALALALAMPAGAQFLLKDGQGLAGAPEPVPEAGAEPTTAPMRKLPEVKVEGEVDPLTKGDKRRRDQIKALPELGTDEERELDRLDKLRAWYDSLPRDPNALSDEQKAFLEEQRDFDAKPASRPGVPDSFERRNAADYRDPIKATGP